MPTAIFGAMGVFTASASATYFCPLVGQINFGTTTTEANSQTLIRSKWKLSTLFVRWDTSGLSAASTVQTRVNSANGNLNVSIPANASGTATDSTNSDSLSSGDTGGYTFVMGAGAGATAILRIVAVLASDFGGFTAASTQKFVGEGMPDTTVAQGLVRNFAISGYTPTINTEANAQWTARIALTSTNLKTHISANSLTASSTLRFRSAGANGNQLVSISNGATGNFEDATNNDVISTGTAINYQLTTGGTDVTSITVDNIQALYSAATFQIGFQILTGGANSPSISAARFDQVQGSIFLNTETETKYTAGIAGKITNLFIRYSANTISSTGTWVSRKNAANGNLSVSISNGATGYFEDTTNVDMIVATDSINRMLSNAATSTGSITLTTRGSIFIPPYNPQPTDAVRVFDGSLKKVIYNILNTTTVLIADSVKKTTTKGLREILRILDLLAPRNKIRFIQSKTASGSGLSMTVTLPNAPTKGNSIILTVGIDSVLLQTVSSITSAGATWVQAAGIANGVLDSEIWYVADLQEAPGAIITINFTGTTLETHATAREYSGLEDINVLDKTATNSGSSSSTDTGTTATTTVANELWVGSTTPLSATNQSAPTNSFTLIDGVAGTLFSNAYLEKFAVAKGAANSGTTSGNVAWAGCIATFKAPTVFEIVVTEILRLVDYIAKRISKPLTDIVRVADSKVLTRLLAFTSTIRIRDTAQLWRTIIKADALRINDFARRTVSKAFTDVVRITDRAAKSLTKVFSDALRIRDNLVKTVSKILREIVRIVDTAVVTKSAAVKQIIVTDMLRITDYVRRTVTKPLIDPLRIRDYLANRTITKTFADPVRITDYTRKTVSKGLREIVRVRDYLGQRVFTKILTDALRIRDYTAKTITKVFTDPVSIRDRLSTVLAHLFKVLVTDMLRITDFTVKTITKALQEIVRIKDVLASSRFKALLLIDMVRVRDYTVKKTSKILTDILRIVDRASASFVGGHLFTVTITDMVRIVDLRIGSIVVLIHQGTAAAKRAYQSIADYLEILLNPSEKGNEKDSVSQ